VGQAFDRAGNVLGEAEGDTKREVFEKLERAHPDADEVRIRKQMLERQEAVNAARGDFGMALNHLRSGRRVSRSGWNGKGMWLALQTPDANSKMSLPYIYMSTVDGNLVPWLASQTDVLANDWGVVE
jgi:hypothetical protein